MEEPNAPSAAVKKCAIIAAFVSFTAAAIAILLTTILLPGALENSIHNKNTPIKITWECVNKQCVKSFELSAARNTSLAGCRMMCDDWGNMWPRPTGIFNMSTTLIKMDRKKVNVHQRQMSINTNNLISSAINRFMKYIELKPLNSKDINEGGKQLDIFINIKDVNYRDLNLNTSEYYDLLLEEGKDSIRVDIHADNFFGARHGLETLEQFIIFDTNYFEVIMPSYLYITDAPVYPYRGISLDTARNYISIDAIKRNLDGMAAAKLNRLHWHITDTHSFPFVSKSYPELTYKGAFSESKVYHPSDIASVVEYALERGVRVIPEFDAPAHVGEGWQDTNLTICFKSEPWDFYCYEPPCGQFDPTKNQLYDMLEGIYKDLIDAFKPDIFHMGGDEVKFMCWNESSDVTTWMAMRGWENNEEGFLSLWEYFQSAAEQRLFIANDRKKVPIILWSSTLTRFENIEKYLNKDDYIIQFWDEAANPELKGLLSKGYRVIISNYDALYFDCGFGSWVAEGNNWCSPYKGWNKVYENDLINMTGGNKELVLGAEAALWTEQVDSASVDGRLWPRLGALAERLWSEPKTSWRDAEGRMLHFREKLINMGIAADSLKPEWCRQNEGFCNLFEESEV